MYQTSSYFYQSNILRRLKYITSSSLSQSNIDKSSSGNIASYDLSLPVIQYLECSNWCLGPTELTLIAEAISSSNASTEQAYPLISIDLSYNHICTDSNELLTDSILQPSQDMDYSGLNNLVTSLLFIAKYSRLKKMNLSFNNLGDEGFKIISELIGPNGPIYLQELVLKQCGYQSIGVRYLSRYLESNRNLYMLDLDGNDIGSHGIAYLADGLSKNKRLKVLSLCSCSIGSEGMTYVTSMLQANYTISTLNLSNNFIGDIGAEIIGSNLKSVQALTSIDLQGNNLTLSGCTSILNGLARNNTITFLGLKWNNISNDIINILPGFIDSNSNLKSLFLVGNPINVEDIEDIMRKAKSKSKDKLVDIDINWSC